MQGCVDSDAALLVLLRSLLFEVRTEADLAVQLFRAAKFLSKDVQQVFLEAVCATAQPQLALDRLQYYHELAAHHRVIGHVLRE